MKPRELHPVEWACQLAVLSIGAYLALDFYFALNAQPCDAPDPGRGCFPWGSEATSALWYYGSKGLYLLHSACTLLLVGTALLMPLLTTTTMRSFAWQLVLVGTVFALPWLSALTVDVL